MVEPGRVRSPDAHYERWRNHKEPALPMIAGKWDLPAVNVLLPRVSTGT